MNKIIEALNSDKKVLVITGAGISTLSGIPDFRGKGGLYTKGENAEYMLSKSCLVYEPERFYEFYKNNMMLENFDCNIIHEVLAKLEEQGKIMGIITQNIDNLHQRAGSNNVVFIHGNGDKYYCMQCSKEYTSEHYKNHGDKCECNGRIRPDIVLYGEGYNRKKLEKCLELIDEAEVLIVLGSSIKVSTIIHFIKMFLRFDDENKELYIANNQPTYYDGYCTDKRYSDDLGKLFEEIKTEIIDNKKLTL